MRARTLAVLWLALGVALWCGIFDIYISRGATDYLRAQAQYELHAAPEAPSMAVVMTRAKHAGALAASLLTGIVVGLGWLTIWLRGGTRLLSQSRGSL